MSTWWSLMHWATSRLYYSLPAITFSCKMIIPLPQSSLPKMLASMEYWEENNWIGEIQTKVLMTTNLCPLHFWMGILNNGRVTVVELLTGGQREARILGIVGKAMLVRLEKLGGVQLVHYVWLPEGRFLKFLWATYEWKPQPFQVHMQRERPQCLHTILSEICGIKT